MSAPYRAADLRPVLRDGALYELDGGRIACGEHAGMTARYTGRCISGQRARRVTPAYAATFRCEVGRAPRCEDCGRTVPVIP